MGIPGKYILSIVSVSIYVYVQSLETTDLGKLQEWCVRDGDVIKCKISAKKPMDFAVIREWTRRQHSENITIDIECDEGAIRLPWPMKAKNLVNLKVLNCMIKDHFKNSYNKLLDREPDFLENLQMINCVIEVNIYDTLERVLNMNYSKSYHCGSEMARSVVKRNITYKFVNTADTTYLTETGVFNEVYDNLKNMDKIVEISCDYENLVAIDHSICKSRGRFYFEHMVARMRYPKLKIYNVSSNLLHGFPSQLSTWSKAFPALQVLDLSNNNFTTFSFTPYSSDLPLRTTPLFVDFQYNKFESFPAGSLLMLYKEPAVIVDLRHNPILCDCRVNELKQYLVGIEDLYPEYSFLLDVKCHGPPNLQGLSVLSLNHVSCEG